MSVKPRKSYTQLIYEAIASSPTKKMVLLEIYQYMEQTYEYFRRCDKGWKVRHRRDACVQNTDDATRIR